MKAEHIQESVQVWIKSGKSLFLRSALCVEVSEPEQLKGTLTISAVNTEGKHPEKHKGQYTLIPHQKKLQVSFGWQSKNTFQLPYTPPDLTNLLYI